VFELSPFFDFLLLCAALYPPVPERRVVRVTAQTWVDSGSGDEALCLELAALWTLDRIRGAAVSQFLKLTLARPTLKVEQQEHYSFSPRLSGSS
jgi:hypothetical protein